MTNGNYELIKKLLLQASESKDEDEYDLAKDLFEAALSYTEYRYNEHFYSAEKRISEDGNRTIAHNHYMDSLNIFLRYEKTLDKRVPDITGYDRKTLGDFANQLVADLAILRR